MARFTILPFIILLHSQVDGFSLVFDTCLPMNMNDDIFARFSVSKRTNEWVKNHARKSQLVLLTKGFDNIVWLEFYVVYEMLFAYQTSKQCNLFDDIKAAEAAAFYQKQIGKPANSFVCMCINALSTERETVCIVFIEMVLAV